MKASSSSVEKKTDHSDDGIYSFDSRKVNDSSPERITSREDSSVERELPTGNPNKIIIDESDDEDIPANQLLVREHLHNDQSNLPNDIPIDQSDIVPSVLRKRATPNTKRRGN